MVRPVSSSNQDNFTPPYAEEVNNAVNQSREIVKEAQDLVKESQGLVKAACDALRDQSKEYRRINEKLDEGIKLGENSIELMDKRIEELNELEIKRNENCKDLDKVNTEEHSIDDTSNKETSILSRCCEAVTSIIEAFFSFVRCVYRALVGE